MNLLETEQLNEKNRKSKMIMSIIIVCIILLLILSLGLLYMIYDVKKNTTKLVVDTKQIAKFSDDLFIIEDDTIYVSIQDFAGLVGYESQNGDHISEGKTRGYVENDYEEASYTLNSNTLCKTLKSGTDNEYFDMKKPIKMINDKLYMSVDGVQIATTCAISYDNSNKQYTVYTLPYLSTYWTGKFADSAVGDKDADFSNQKALLYDMIVVKNSSDKYGVRGLNNEEIIGTKYASIKFIESTKEFIIKTDDGKMGILSSKGVTKIEPVYDSISQIDKNLNLYLVSNNKKYGVVNQTGNIIIFLEYDKIGVDLTQFRNNDIKNGCLLFDNCIPVQRDKKWGFFDKTGKQIVPVEYDGIGCILSTGSGSSQNNILVIPEYEAIVVQKDKSYGLIDSLGKELIPCRLDLFYSITNSGQNEYYMRQGEVEREVISWLEEQGIKRPSGNIEIDEYQDINTNTITNEVQNNEIIPDVNISNSYDTNTVTDENIGENLNVQEVQENVQSQENPFSQPPAVNTLME